MSLPPGKTVLQASASQAGDASTRPTRVILTEWQHDADGRPVEWATHYELDPDTAESALTWGHYHRVLSAAQRDYQLRCRALGVAP